MLKAAGKDTCGVKGKGSLICIAHIMSYTSVGARIWHVLTRDHTALPSTLQVYPQVE